MGQERWTLGGQGAQGFAPAPVICLSHSLKDTTISGCCLSNIQTVKTTDHKTNKKTGLEENCEKGKQGINEVA